MKVCLVRLIIEKIMDKLKFRAFARLALAVMQIKFPMMWQSLGSKIVAAHKAYYNYKFFGAPCKDVLAVDKTEFQIFFRNQT
jgi:hypothetical protein